MKKVFGSREKPLRISKMVPTKGCGEDHVVILLL